MPERFEAYLQQVGGQIRWKRAVPVLTRELKTHLLEQYDDCTAGGMNEDKAEAETLRQMGDALEIGRELDAVHRPKPQWGLLALVAVLALAGGVLRAVTGWYVPSRVCLFLCVGFVSLAAGYFLDYSYFGRHAGAFCLALLLVSIAAMEVLPHLFNRFFGYYFFRNGVNYYAYYLTLLFPLAYALGVYVLRGRRWGGYAAALAAACAFAVIAPSTGRLSAFVIFGISALATLCYAIKRGWFGTARKAQYTVLALCAALPCALGWLRYRKSIASRLDVILHPETEAFGRGFQPNIVREALRASIPWGEGAALRYEIREGHSNYLLANVAHRWGLISFALLCAALAALFVFMLIKCLRMKNELGGLLTLSLSIALGLRIAFYIAYNLGYSFLLTECPLLSGNLHTIIDMGLIGVMLSVFRQERLPEMTIPVRHTADRPCRFRWHDGELTVSFRAKAN